MFMKKKSGIFVSLLLCAFILSGCGSENKEIVEQDFSQIENDFLGMESHSKEEMDEKKQSVSGSVDYAMIVNVKDENLSVYNKGIWNGMREYAEQKKKSYRYYTPKTEELLGTVEAMEEAVLKGASVIFCSGSSAKEALLDMQEDYPAVSFVWLDGEKNTKLSENVLNVQIDYSDAGYMAGICSVIEGKSEFGFLGNEDQLDVLNGFAQGLNYKAEEQKEERLPVLRWSLKADSLSSQERMELLDGWKKDGMEVLCCTGEIYEQMEEWIKEEQIQVILTDQEQEAASDEILTALMVDYQEMVKYIMEQIFAGTAKGGEEAVCGGGEKAVGLNLPLSNFNNVSEREYRSIRELFSEKNISTKECGGIREFEKMQFHYLDIPNM